MDVSLRSLLFCVVVVVGAIGDASADDLFSIGCSNWAMSTHHSDGSVTDQSAAQTKQFTFDLAKRRYYYHQTKSWNPIRKIEENRLVLYHDKGIRKSEAWAEIRRDTWEYESYTRFPDPSNGWVTITMQCRTIPLLTIPPQP